MPKNNELYLAIVVDDKGSPQVKRFGDNVERATKRGTAGFLAMDGSLGGFIARAAGAVSVMAGITAAAHKLVDVSREFDKINAGLVTATGSADNAGNAFAAIQDFATSTPYDLAQVTDSFVKLVNYGLNPSERALTSYGNTSSALGKDLMQMIEAVADAATGEFERLKEFGIRASSEGDRVKFTFRGVTTEVGKNAAEIEEYLIRLGETNFGDAMANRMKTLDGALSNLGDEWNKVFLNISQAGIGDLIADGVVVGISALEELNAQIVSGELEAKLRANADRWSGWADDITATMDYVSDRFDMLGDDGTGTVDFLIKAFWEFPENVRALIGIMAVEVASGFEKVMVYSKAFKEQLKAVFTDPTDTTSYFDRVKSGKEAVDKARLASIDAVLEEHGVAIDAAEEHSEKIKKLRAEYEAQRDAAKANTADRLAQYKFDAGNGGQGAGSGVVTRTKAEETAYNRGREALQRYIETQDERIRKEYEAVAAFARTEDEKTRALARYDEQLAEQKVSAYQSLYGRVGTVSQQMYDTLRGQYERDRDEFIANGVDKLTAYEDYQARIQELDEKGGKFEKVDLELEDFFGDLDDMSARHAETVDEMENAFSGWGRNFSRTLSDAVWGAKGSFEEILESFGRMLTEMWMQKKIVEPLFNNLFSSGSGGSGGGGMLGGLFGWLGGLLGFAQGGLPGGEGLSAYRNQIIGTPTLFAFAQGGVGVFGEAGEEGIFPVKRMSSGNLGVEAKLPETTNQPPKWELHIHEAQGTKATVRQSEDGMRMDVMIELVENSINRRIGRGAGSLAWLGGVQRGGY